MSIHDITPEVARLHIRTLALFNMKNPCREETRQMKKITIARDLKLIDFNALTNFAGAQHPMSAPGTGDDKGEYTRLLRRRLMCAYVDAACDAYKQRRGMYPMVVEELLNMLKEMDK